MTELARFNLQDGGSVLVEVDTEPGVTRVGKQGRFLTEAKSTFDATLAQIRDAASAALTQFTTMPRQPDEVELKFGVKVDAQAGAIIAKTGVSGQLEVKLKWRADGPRDPESEADDQASGRPDAVT